MRGTLCWGPYNKDVGSLQSGFDYLGYYIRVPYFQKPPVARDTSGGQFAWKGTQREAIAGSLGCQLASGSEGVRVPQL